MWREGYWVQSSLKVELTKDDKAAIGRPSSPRWELDLVAYGGRRNELLVVECKSYLDSIGVQYRAFSTAEANVYTDRFKLFNDEPLRNVIVARLCSQLVNKGLVSDNPDVKLVLVCGKIVRDKDRQLIRAHFDDHGWVLWDDEWLKEKLKEMSTGSYENSPVAVVAKLLLRRVG